MGLQLTASVTLTASGLVMRSVALRLVALGCRSSSVGLEPCRFCTIVMRFCDVVDFSRSLQQHQGSGVWTRWQAEVRRRRREEAIRQRCKPRPLLAVLLLFVVSKPRPLWAVLMLSIVSDPTIRACAWRRPCPSFFLIRVWQVQGSRPASRDTSTSRATAMSLPSCYTAVRGNAALRAHN